ncbi:hypothetical protein SAMN02983003_2565 [Devosia enhydra]|uniref:Uncharacterized protein n=1 Tax=Devosia enhydra TaxID=665118 RepID=A0A1K2HZ49_9HYPH|nr:hypothetical protein [Devosia enhydra]SFZ85402.1 hypothetical protein SAMN02983003_2565 [Devosia enhydra]
MIAFGRRKVLNIPYFAIEKSDKSSQARAVTDLAQIREVIGGHQYRWLSTTPDLHNAWRLIETRTYVPLKSAVYSNWLLFSDDYLQRRFLEQFPNMSRAHRIIRLSTKLEQLRTSLQKGLLAGGYDLSKRAPESRVNVAQSYVKKATTISELQNAIDALTAQEHDLRQWHHLTLAMFP